VRLKLTETPAFKAALEAEPPAKVPLAELLRHYPRETIGGAFAVVACSPSSTSPPPSPRLRHHDPGYDGGLPGRAAGAIVLPGHRIVSAAWLSDRSNPRRVLLVGCGLTVLVGGLLAPMLGSGSLPLIWLFLSLACW